MDTCLAELGTDSIEFTFNTTNDPFNVESNTLIISMWKEVFGDQVAGHDHADRAGPVHRPRPRRHVPGLGWRSHSGTDPDQQRLWWQSARSTPIGALALNFGRFQDDVMDEHLDIIKTNPDPAARKAAAEDVNRRFGEQVYNCGSTGRCGASSRSRTSTASRRNTLPDGGRASAWPFAGRHQMNQIWCDDGDCE